MKRRELHALVWDKPMMHLAQSLGLSGNGLRKVCVRYNVPVPPRGYWQRLQSGAAPPRPALDNPTFDPTVRFSAKMHADGTAKQVVQDGIDSQIGDVPKAHRAVQPAPGMQLSSAPLVRDLKSTHATRQASTREHTGHAGDFPLPPTDVDITLAPDESEPLGGGFSGPTYSEMSSRATLDLSDPLKLAELYFRVQGLGNLLVDVESKMTDCDASTRAVMTLWLRFARNCAGRIHLTEQIAQSCAIVAHGSEQPSWWTDLQCIFRTSSDAAENRDKGDRE